MSTPFSQVGGLALSVDEALGTNVPDGTTLWFFVPESGRYFYYLFSTFDGGWTDEDGNLCGANKILRGEGFWVQAVTNMTVSFAGEVPSAATAPTTTVTIIPGFTLIGHAYPASTVLNSSLSPVDGDTIWRYSTATGRYSYYLYSTFDGGWTDEDGNLSDVKLNVGEGAWYQSVSASTNVWSQVRPYTWP